MFLRIDIFSTFKGLHKLILTYVSYIVIGLHQEPANFCREKAKRWFRDWPFVYFSGGCISYLFGDYANINM